MERVWGFSRPQMLQPKSRSAVRAVRSRSNLHLACNIMQEKDTSQQDRSLIEPSLNPLVAISSEGKITDVNQALVRATGVPREKIIGTDFSYYFTEPEKAHEVFQQVFAKGFVTDYHLTIRDTNGNLTYGMYNATLYKDDEGNVLGALATARDITLNSSTLCNQNLMQAPLDLIVAISEEGKITDVNEALVRATGVPKEKLIGMEFSYNFTEPNKTHDGCQQGFAKDHVADYVLTIRHSTGDVPDSISGCLDLKEKLPGGFAAAREVTGLQKQKMKIKALKALNKELEQRVIELESFSYSVSHDLRAPLRKIEGFISVFLDKHFSIVDSEGQRLLYNVRRNVETMKNLISDLLTLSRVGIGDIHITEVDMTELTNTVLEELGEIRGKAAVTVRSLGKAKGDIALIRQILVNLISNAFKYSSKKGKPQIEIGGYAQNGEMIYYVKDNGVGFDMEYSNKLFGVFQRLHDPMEYPGIGVGLAIVRRIIARHGGRVWAEGIKGEGATFYFSLKTSS